MSRSKDKRKVQDTSFEDQDQPFRNSKLTARSPPRVESEVQSINSVEKMDQIMQAITNMREDMNKGFQKNREQTENLACELKMLREEMNKKEEEWKKEREGLHNKIGQMEERMEMLERRERGNNIIIKNTEMEGEDLTKEVTQFIKREMNMDVEVTEAYELRKGIVLAKLKKRTEKRNIMIKKNVLKETQIYVEDDLTYKERQIQKKLREVARKERGNGKQVKVSYQKITIDKKTYAWRDIEEQMEAKN